MRGGAAESNQLEACSALWLSPGIPQAPGQCLLIIQAVYPSFAGLLLCRYDLQQDCPTPTPNFNHMLIFSYAKLFQIYCFLTFLSLRKKNLLISCMSEA